MTDKGAAGDYAVRGLALEADPTIGHKSSATFNDGGSISINSTNKSVLGMFVSGGTSTNVKGDFAVSVTSGNDANGIHAQYGGTVKSEKDATMTVSVTATDSEARALRLAYYGDDSGTAELLGDVSLAASGKKAWGVSAGDGSSATLGSEGKTVTISAQGTESATGVVANGAGTEIIVDGAASVTAKATGTDAADYSRVYGVSTMGAAGNDNHASITFNNNATITTESTRNDWHVGAYAYDADLAFAGETKITMTDTGKYGDYAVRGLSLEADPETHKSYASFSGPTTIAITTGAKTAQGVFVSGGDVTASGAFNVDVKSTSGHLNGIRVQNSGKFTNTGDTSVKVDGKKNSDGVVLATYSTGSGSAFLGDLSVDVKGETARGIALEDTAKINVSGDTSIKVTATSGEAMGIYSNSVNGGTFGDTTIDVTGGTGRTYGINVRTASDTATDNPKLAFGKTTITVANGADNTQYLEGVHVDYSDIEFASLDLTVTDNATKASTAANGKATDVRGVNLQGDDGLDKAHATFKGDTSINLTTEARNGYGIIASSGTSASMAGNLDIDVSTEGNGSATGILSRYGGAVTSASGTTVDVSVKAENGDAKALHLVGFGSENKPGTASLLGDVTLTAEGRNAVHGAALYDGAEATLGSSGSTVTISATTSTTSADGFASGLVANGAGTKAVVNGVASISAENTGSAGRVYGISSTGVANKRAAITFNDDVSITTASNSNDWHIGAYAYDADLAFKGALNVNMTDTGTDDSKSVRGLALESDPNHVSTATLGNGGSITIASANKAVRGMFVSGGVSTTVGGDLAVDVTSTNNEAAGLHVQYGGKLVSDAGTSINVVAKGKTAYALSLVDYSGSTGSATFNGDVTLEAQGAKAEDSHAVYGTGSITNSGNFTVKSGLLSSFTGSYAQTAGTTAISADSGFFGGKVTIADGILSVGDVDTSEAKGATVAIGAPVKLGAGTDMLVSSTASLTNTGSKVEFGSGSMLIVDAEKLGDEAAFTGTGTTSSTAGGQEFHAAADSKLHILNAKAGQDIVIAQGFAKDVEEYSKNNVTFANPLLDPAQVAVKDNGDDSNGQVILTLGQSVKDPTEVYGDVDASNALVEVTQQGSDGIGGDMVQSFLNSGSRDASALNEVASAAVTAGVQNTALRLADAASNTVLNHMSLAQHDGTHAIHSGGVDFWATPMYGNLYTSGMAAPDASVRGQFGGLALGADLEAGHFLGGQFRLGAAIHGGGGQSEAKGTACSVQNDYDFGGVNLYAGWNSGAFNLIGSVGYAFGNHEVEMGLPFAGFGTAKADVDSTAFTADLRAEYQLKTNWVDVLPHVGVRYTALRTDGYDLKAGGVLNSVDRVTQNIVQFPIGVTLSKDFAFTDWNVKPMVDVSFIPALGDKDVETKVRFSGVNAVDSFDSRVMDSSSWAATMGVQAEKGDFTLGLSYGVQASSHETDQNIQLKLGWKF